MNVRLSANILVFSFVAASTAALGQQSDGALPAPGLVGEATGSGDWPAVAQSRADLRTHTLYRPSELTDVPMPVLLWGNGGCSDNGLDHRYFLREVSSHGYLIVALGRAVSDRYLEGEPQPDASDGETPVRPRTPASDPTTVEQHYYALDWLESRNADPRDELYGKVDMARIAVAGHSCGGLQAIKTAADPRIMTAMIFNSGVYTNERGISSIEVSKSELDSLHGPVAYITGGPSDIAHENSVDDVSRIDHVPVFFGWLDVGHGGTFWKAEDGGEYSAVAVKWLDWQFKGDTDSGRWFQGENCVLCEMEEWTVPRTVDTSLPVL